MTTIPLVVSIISLSLCVSGFFFLRWYISQRTEASRLLEEYRDEVYRLISEIDAATDRDSRLVEDRIKNLRTLLDDTDKRISVYTREIQRSRNSEAIYKNLGKGIRAALDSIPAEPVSSVEPASPAEPVPPAETTPPVEINELPFTDEEKGRSPQTRGTKKQKKRKKANTQTPAAHPEKTGIKMQIAQMAIQGMSPSEIASLLEISSAEVELALQLININNK
jgi:hypothetical protein